MQFQYLQVLDTFCQQLRDMSHLEGVWQGWTGRSIFQRGEDKNPQGGVKVKIRGVGRGKKTHKSTDPKI